MSAPVFKKFDSVASIQKALSGPKKTHVQAALGREVVAFCTEGHEVLIPAPSGALFSHASCLSCRAQLTLSHFLVWNAHHILHKLPLAVFPYGNGSCWYGQPSWRE